MDLKYQNVVCIFRRRDNREILSVAYLKGQYKSESSLMTFEAELHGRYPGCPVLCSLLSVVPGDIGRCSVAGVLGPRGRDPGSMPLQHRGKNHRVPLLNGGTLEGATTALPCQVGFPAQPAPVL